VMRPARSVHFDRVRRAASSPMSRRRFLAAGAGAAAAGLVIPQLTGSAGVAPSRASRSLGHSTQADFEEALAVLGRTTLRQPGSLPDPSLLPGTDTMPEIEHIVVLMLENHSFDNIFGMLGRGDGFKLSSDGLPVASNPYGNGQIQHAFEMPTTCQLPAQPSQEWEASHVQYANGLCNGFVESSSGPVAMGYWTGKSLPFTYALAKEFPIGDRFFCSVLGQTDPNRRYLIAATSSGMTDDIGTSPGNIVPDVTLAAPANGTIFDLFEVFGISWNDYCASFPLGCTAELYPIDDAMVDASEKSIDNFFSDAASGNLPGFCIVDPDYSNQSQENPQNIVVGESFLEQAVRAIGSSPDWARTLLIINYDEHGGYYDHVVPPVAIAPDAVPPIVQPGESLYDGFNRYGFRVPSIVVSPYAKRDHVSHVVYDHTSILAMVERKWNLPALTYRDANANDLMDFLDAEAIARGVPTFAELPKLPPSGSSTATLACSTSGPGTIPPAGSVSGTAG
jgi:phospholipase C